MGDQLLQELEQAAQVILAPLNVITPEMRHAADAVFLKFRKTKAPLESCKHILETSKVDYVLFEAAGVFKEVISREWSHMKDEIKAVQQFLLSYVVERPTLAPFVRERILQVIAITVKVRCNEQQDRSEMTGEREGVVQAQSEDLSAEQTKLLDEIEHLVMSGDLPRQVLACSLISAIMQEHSEAGKSTYIGLRRVEHRNIKQKFELNHLMRVFGFCLRVTTELIRAEKPFNSTVLVLMKHLLSILECVLTWQFTRATLFVRLGSTNMADLIDHAPLRPHPRWKICLLQPNIFFEIYWNVRDDPYLAHHALTCLVQLATLQGSIFSASSEEVTYWTTYAECLLNLISSIEVLDREALGISNVIRKFWLRASSRWFEVRQDVTVNFLREVTRLTCQFGEGAALEESMNVVDTLYIEAFEHMLGVCVGMDQNGTFALESSMQIFNTYIKCHLSPPDGSRGSGQELEAEDIGEIEEDDQTKFKGQLQSIGALGRSILEHVLPLLCKLLEERTSRLHSQLQRMSQQAMHISDSNILNNLSEDIHWLILISGHVLAWDSAGETPQIPEEIMKHSISQSTSINMDTTMKVLASPDHHILDIPSAEQSSDHVIRLIAALFRLCEVEKKAAEAKLGHLLSPEVGRSLMWCLERWCGCYLLPVEEDYSELSLAIMTAFGADTEGASWTVNFLLKKVESNLKYFNSEPELVKETIAMFRAMVCTKQKAACVLKNEGILNIVYLQENLPQGKLPQQAKRGLYTALTLAAAGLPESNRPEYWLRILKPIQDRFKSIICHELFTRNYHEERVKSAIIEILDHFIGVVKGTLCSTSEAVFQYLAPVLSEFSTLVGLYHNYQDVVELILDLHNECAKQLLIALSPADRQKMYNACLQTIQTYAQWNTNRLSLENVAEEETFKDILLLLELIRNLSAKDFEDLHTSTSPVDQQQQGLTSSDVVIYGLHTIMLIMTGDLLKYPTLCTQYFKAIMYTVEMIPEKVHTLPSDLLKRILASVEVGLVSFGHEIMELCCNFLFSFGWNVLQNASKESEVYLAFKSFLNIFLNLILTDQVPQDVLQAAGNTLYVLILHYPEDYKLAVQSIINNQPDPVAAEQVAAAFTTLAESMEVIDRSKRAPILTTWQLGFLQFYRNIHGFVCVNLN